MSLERRNENVTAGYLDSACWARNGVTGETIAEAINKELAKANLALFSKSSKGRVEGANAFKQRLIGNKNSKGDFIPAIKFFTTCVHTARTIPMLGHDSHNLETYDTNGEDHLADAICYACMSRPFAPMKAIPQRKFDAYQNEIKSSVWTI